MWSLTVASGWYQSIRRSLPGSTTVFELELLTMILQAQVVGLVVSDADIAKMVDMTPRRCSRFIKRFVKVGILVSELSPNDRRRHVVRHSDESMEGFDKWAREMAVHVEWMTRIHLSPKGDCDSTSQGSGDGI